MASKNEDTQQQGTLPGGEPAADPVEAWAGTVADHLAATPQEPAGGPQEPAGAHAGAVLDTIDRQAVLDLLKPRSIPFVQWAAALMDQGDFAEEGAELGGLGIVAAILTAATSAETFAAMDMFGADRLVGEEPGGRSPLMRFTGCIPLESTFEEGASCFGIFSAILIEKGEQIQFSCGARAVQATVMKHMYEGWMPFDAFLVRRRKPTRRGFYPLNLEAAG